MSAGVAAYTPFERMADSVLKTFKATLERGGPGLTWTVIRIPFAVSDVWGTRGQLRVRGEVNGATFATALFPTREGRHFMLVNKKLQKDAGIALGEVVRFQMEPDATPRSATMPKELEKLLAQSKPLRRWLDTLNRSSRNDIYRWVSEPKSETARRRRAEQIAERLMETMEAEQELPPLLKLAFARDPRAYEGWRMMTERQRRLELLAIFYYRTPEGRAKRLAKTLENARSVADKRCNED